MTGDGYRDGGDDSRDNCHVVMVTGMIIVVVMVKEMLMMTMTVTVCIAVMMTSMVTCW